LILFKNGLNTEWPEAGRAALRWINLTRLI
jgi:hypothetical protein